MADDKDKYGELYSALFGALSGKKPNLYGLDDPPSTIPGPLTLPPLCAPIRHPGVLAGITRARAAAESEGTSPVGIKVMTARLKFSALKKLDLSAGRVVPKLDAIAIGDARAFNAAFLYADLDGFTQLVKRVPTPVSFQLLQTFVEATSRIADHFGGDIVDCAGDRVLAVFYRPTGDKSADPIREAITAGLWMQTIMQRVIAPLFSPRGVPNAQLAIGIDYSPAVIGCVGIRGSKRLVFVGEAANHAAKLQDSGKGGETVLSPVAFANSPTYLSASNGWPITPIYGAGGTVERYIISGVFAGANGDGPPARSVYLK